jgi:bifunctional non-homologous end joining protein LigD
VPTGDRWIHEVKFDGYRVQVHIANEDVRIFTRRGHDWTKRFAKIAADAWHLNVKSAIIDGEVIVPAADGISDFSVLQSELRGKSTKLVLYVSICSISTGTTCAKRRCSNGRPRFAL